VWGFEPQSNRCFLGPTRAHIPNSVLIGSAIFAQLTAESPYTYNRPPLSANLIHGSLGTPKSTPQTASESVQPFSQGSRSQETGSPCWSICGNRPHLCCTAMWPNNHANICKGTVNQKSQLNQLCWKKSLLDYDAKYNVQCTSEMSVTSACTARLRFLIKNALYKSTVITVIIIITVVHSPYASVNEAAP